MNFKRIINYIIVHKLFKEGLNYGEYIYHGTSKGAAKNIQNDGYLKTNNTGEIKPSISFTKNMNYANYYAKSKGGSNNSVILRTKLDDNFELSNRIRDNKGYEFITFKNISVENLEILTHHYGWKPLNKWDVIFDEPLI